MAFYQIKDTHFRDCANSTIYNRLSKLIRSGIIDSVRVNLIAIHKGNMDIGVVYSLTKEGLTLLKTYSHFEIKRAVPIPINFNQLTHDLILIDVLKKMDGVNSKLVSFSNSYGDQVPDGIVTRNNKKVAIEVELTAKSNLRYREIVSNYRTSSKYDEVLYIVKDKAIQKKISDIITENLGNYFNEGDTDKFGFITLKEFFSENNLIQRRDEYGFQETI